MKCLSYLTGLFKAPEQAGPEEIALHVRRLNMLLQTYQQLKTMTVAEWHATEREIEMELQWFDIHHLEPTNTSYPTVVHSTDTSSLPGQFTHTARTDEQLEKRPV